jgi:hypothetical protein
MVSLHNKAWGHLFHTTMSSSVIELLNSYINSLWKFCLLGEFFFQKLQMVAPSDHQQWLSTSWVDWCLSAPVILPWTDLLLACSLSVHSSIMNHIGVWWAFPIWERLQPYFFLNEITCFWKLFSFSVLCKNGKEVFKDHQPVCVSSINNFWTSWWIWMKFCIEVMPLKGTSMW